MAYDFNSLTKQGAEATNRDKYYTDFEDVDPNKLHQISELTEWMRTKGKGSDVREVIAQLFERTWVEGIKEGNANLEVAQARGPYSNLAERLAIIDALANSKADEGEIISMLNNILDGSPKGTYPNLAALQSAKPNGDSGIYLTTDNGHWYYYQGGWKDGGIYQSPNITTEAVQAETTSVYPAKGSLTKITAQKNPNNNEFTISFTGKRYIVVGARDDGRFFNVIDVTVSSPLVLNHNQVLVFNPKNNSIYVTDWTDDFVSDTVILAVNSLGILYGQWADMLFGYQSLKTDGQNEVYFYPGYGINTTIGESNQVTVTFTNETKTGPVLLTAGIGADVLETVTLAQVVGSEIVLNNYDIMLYDYYTKTIRKYSYEAYKSNIVSNYPHKVLLYNIYGHLFGSWANETGAKETGSEPENPLSYYFKNNYLPNKIKQINDNNSFVNGVSFFFATDCHFYSNAGKSARLINYIQSKTGIELTINGGDMVRAYGTEADIKKDAEAWSEWQATASRTVLAVPGNHDFTIKKSENELIGYTLSDGYRYNVLTRPIETYDNLTLAGPGKNYWYADNEVQKTRYIGLDVYEMRGGTEHKGWEDNNGSKTAQLKWLANEALAVKDGWRIIVIQHSPIDSNLQGYIPQVKPVWDILAAYQNRRSASITNAVDDKTPFPVDFSSAKGRIILNLSGHWHHDADAYTDGILSVNTFCDAFYNDDPNYTTKRVKGTINEHAFDVVSIDYDAETIKCVRIGAGATEQRRYNFNGQRL